MYTSFLQNGFFKVGDIKFDFFDFTENNDIGGLYHFSNRGENQYSELCTIRLQTDRTSITNFLGKSQNFTGRDFIKLTFKGSFH